MGHYDPRRQLAVWLGVVAFLVLNTLLREWPIIILYGLIVYILPVALIVALLWPASRRAILLPLARWAGAAWRAASGVRRDTD